MKKRLVSMLLMMLCMFTVALPANAADEHLYVYGADRVASTSLLPGNSVQSMYIDVYDPTDYLVWTLTDQNDNQLYSDTISPWPTGYKSFVYERTNRPPGINLSFGPDVTGIKLTIECAGNPGCEAFAFIEVN